MAATGVTTTAAAAAATMLEPRLSVERLPGEPEPSTDDERPWTADAITTQQHHHYRSDSHRPSAPPQEQSQQPQTCSTSAAAATATPSSVMITVAACGSRAPRPKPRPPTSASATMFPVDVADRLRSPVVSLIRPRQYGRRRSVQDAVASAIALHQQQEHRQQFRPLAPVGVIVDEPEPDADRERDLQEPRLVTPLRLVVGFLLLI